MYYVIYLNKLSFHTTKLEIKVTIHTLWYSHENIPLLLHLFSSAE